MAAGRRRHARFPIGLFGMFLGPIGEGDQFSFCIGVVQLLNWREGHGV
jgi:hypothetical protein